MRETASSRVLFSFEELQERGDDALRLAGVAAAIGDDGVLHGGRVLHLHCSQGALGHPPAPPLAPHHPPPARPPAAPRRRPSPSPRSTLSWAGSSEPSSITPRGLTPAERNAPCVIS